MPGPTLHYPPEFKQEAVRLYRSSNRSPAAPTRPASPATCPGWSAATRLAASTSPESTPRRSAATSRAPCAAGGESPVGYSVCQVDEPPFREGSYLRGRRIVDRFHYRDRGELGSRETVYARLYTLPPVRSAAYDRRRGPGYLAWRGAVWYLV